MVQAVLTPASRPPTFDYNRLVLANVLPTELQGREGCDMHDWNTVA